MTEAVRQLEQRLRREAAPLFCQVDEQQTMNNERIPKGFIGNEETADCREKLKELLAPAVPEGQNAGTIANECDRMAAKRILGLDRRFTKAEANFVTDLYGSYEVNLKVKVQSAKPKVSKRQK